MKSPRGSEGALTPGRKLNNSSTRATYIYADIYIDIIEAASPSRTRTQTKSLKEINGRRRQAQNAGAEQ